jgi:hypothetical protein
VKRCGKSAPLEAQATRHGKPHRVQGQIGDLGAARSMFRESETGSGYWPLRQMILSVPQGTQTEFGLQPFQNFSCLARIKPPFYGDAGVADVPFIFSAAARLAFASAKSGLIRRAC